MRTRSKLLVLLAFSLALSVARPQALAQAPETSLDDFVVFGTELVAIGERADISSGDVGSNGAVEVDEDASIGGSVFGDEVTLEERVTVLGNVSFNVLEKGEDAVIGGAELTPVSIPIVDLPPLPSFSPGDEDVDVPDGETISLPPGAFGVTRVGEGATLNLEGGTYNIEELRVSEDGVVLAEDPSTLNIAARLELAERAQLNGAAGVGPGDVRINFAGTEEVEIGEDATVGARLLAPGAQVNLGVEGGSGGITWGGSVYARSVLVGEASSMMLAANGSPVLAPIGNQTVPLGSSLNLTLSATDPDGDSVSFGASPLPLPPHASLNAATGAFGFTPDATQAGSIQITFLASDGRGGTDSEMVTITVQGPAPGGVTALTGQLLDTNDFVQGTETPVVGATVSLLGTTHSTTSGSDGRFTLTGVPAGSQVLDIATATANPAPDGSPYSGFREEITLIEGVTNVVGRPFFLPRVAMESLTTVNPGATTVVTNPTLNTTMTVPPNTAKNADGSNFTGQLSISVVPEGLAPAALPDELEPGLLITIQPVGVTFATPVPITFPNIDNLAPGSETNIWSLDPATGTFVVVGRGRVSADGSRIETISGGIRAADWHMALPPAGEGATENSENNQENQGGDQSADCNACAAGGATVSPQTGGFTRDPALPSYRSQGVNRTVEFIYDSESANPRPVIPFDSTILFQAAVPPSVSYTLEVGGVQQGGEVFVNTSGLSEGQDETIRNAVQFDASNLPTGRYPYTLRITSNYSFSRVSTTVRGEVLVTNETRSPFGTGWTLDGLQRLHQQPDGSAVLTQGDGSTLVFPGVPAPACAQAPAGLVSCWPGDGNAEDIVDGNHGILRNGTSFGPGKIGQAFSLDGVDNFIEVTDPGPGSNLDQSSFSLDAWINVPAAKFFAGNTIGFQTVVAKTTAVSGGFLRNYALHVTPANDPLYTPGTIIVSFTDGINNWRVAQGTTVVADGQWHHVAGTYDGVSLRVFVDGIEETTAAFGGAFPVGGGLPDAFDGPVSIGLDVPSAPLWPMDGLIDEVGLYNRALSAAEVQAVFAAGNSPAATQRFAAPAGDFSTLNRNADGTFTRTFKDGSRIEFNAQGGGRRPWSTGTATERRTRTTPRAG